MCKATNTAGWTLEGWNEMGELFDEGIIIGRVVGSECEYLINISLVAATYIISL